MTQSRPHRVHPLPLMGGHRSGVQECPTYNERYNGNPSALEVIAYFGYLVVISIYYLKFRNDTEKSVDHKHQAIPNPA